MFMYSRVHSAFLPYFALSRIHLRLFNCLLEEYFVEVRGDSDE